jgi:hypothetical protein
MKFNFFSNIINGVKKTFGFGKDKSKENNPELQQSTSKEKEQISPEAVEKEEEKKPESSEKDGKEEKENKEGDIDKSEKDKNNPTEPTDKSPPPVKEGDNSNNPTQSKPPNTQQTDRLPIAKDKDIKEENKSEETKSSKQTQAQKKHIIATKNNNPSSKEDNASPGTKPFPFLSKIEDRQKLYPLSKNQNINTSVDKINGNYSTTC